MQGPSDVGAMSEERVAGIYLLPARGGHALLLPASTTTTTTTHTNTRTKHCTEPQTLGHKHTHTHTRARARLALSISSFAPNSRRTRTSGRVPSTDRRAPRVTRKDRSLRSLTGRWWVGTIDRSVELPKPPGTRTVDCSVRCLVAGAAAAAATSPVCVRIQTGTGVTGFVSPNGSCRWNPTVESHTFTQSGAARIKPGRVEEVAKPKEKVKENG